MSRQKDSHLDALYKHMSKIVPIDFTYFNKIITDAVNQLRRDKVAYVFHKEHLDIVQQEYPEVVHDVLHNGTYILYPKGEKHAIPKHKAKEKLKKINQEK